MSRTQLLGSNLGEILLDRGENYILRHRNGDNDQQTYCLARGDPMPRNIGGRDAQGRSPPPPPPPYMHN